jgi:hypothetical protein
METAYFCTHVGRPAGATVPGEERVGMFVEILQKHRASREHVCPLHFQFALDIYAEMFVAMHDGALPIRQTETIGDIREIKDTFRG